MESHTPVDHERDQQYTLLVALIKQVRQLELQHLIFGDRCPPPVRAEIERLHAQIFGLANHLTPPQV